MDSREEQVVVNAQIKCKKYVTRQGDVHAIQNIDIRLARGTLLGIFGPNGCGKSSLLRILAGLDGDFEGTPPYPERRPRIGFVFQDYSDSLFPWLKNLDNISYPLVVQGIGRKERMEKVTALLNEVGLVVDLQSYPYQQSGGQQQLVGLLRAMIAEPDLLILDEPFSSLDMRTTEKARSALDRYCARETPAVIFVSHELDEVLMQADEILVMRRVGDGHVHGSVIGKVHVPFPKPREAGLLETEEFHHVRAEVLSILRRHSPENVE